MDALENRLDQAKTEAAAEMFSLPYEFLTDSQRLYLIDLVAYKYAALEIEDYRKQLNNQTKTSQHGN